MWSFLSVTKIRGFLFKTVFFYKRKKNINSHFSNIFLEDFQFSDSMSPITNVSASQRCECYLFDVVELCTESAGVALLEGGNQINHLPIVLLSDKIPQSVS